MQLVQGSSLTWFIRAVGSVRNRLLPACLSCAGPFGAWPPLWLSTSLQVNEKGEGDPLAHAL